MVFSNIFLSIKTRSQMDIQALVSRTFNNPSEESNYQRKYEQVKKNSATFIKLVENELSKILTDHKKQKSRLQKQNYLLRQRLNKANKELETHQTYHKDASNVSESNYFFQENGRDVMNCGISNISHLDRKSGFFDQKKSSILKYALTDRSNTGNTRKDKSMTTLSLTSKIASEPQQCLNNSLLSSSQVSQMYEIKQRFNKQRGAKKTNVCKIKDKDMMSQVLKKIRDKSQNYNPSLKSQNDEQKMPANIISPGMYGYLKKRI